MERQSNGARPVEAVFRPSRREREVVGSRASDGRRTSVTQVPANQQTRGVENEENRSKAEVVKNDRQAQHLVLFRGMRVDMP